MPCHKYLLPDEDITSTRIKRGREAKAVYRNKELDAANRSIWYPQPITMKKIGTKESSK